MIRKEAMKDSNIWQNIGEVAVQTSNLTLSVHSYALLRLILRSLPVSKLLSPFKG